MAERLSDELDEARATLTAVSLAVARWRQGDQGADEALVAIEAAVAAPDEDETGEGGEDRG